MNVSDQHHAPATLLPGKVPRFPLNRLGGPQSQSGRFGEETNLLSLARFEPRTVRLSLISISTTLGWRANLWNGIGVKFWVPKFDLFFEKCVYISFFVQCKVIIWRLCECVFFFFNIIHPRWYADTEVYLHGLMMALWAETGSLITYCKWSVG
jgi:hypothetical protein